MQCVIFTGLQASGKSSFYAQRFFDTHVRVNLDMLRTRRREMLLIAACLEGRQPFVVDNTNPRREDRARYILPAREARFEVVGYYFVPDIEGCLRRNTLRSGKAAVPPKAIWATLHRLEPPGLVEGFAALYTVQLRAEGHFDVSPWNGSPHE